MEEDLICYDLLPASRTEAVMARAIFIQRSQVGVMAGSGGWYWAGPRCTIDKSEQGETNPRSHTTIRNLNMSLFAISSLRACHSLTSQFAATSDLRGYQQLYRKTNHCIRLTSTVEPGPWLPT